MVTIKEVAKLAGVSVTTVSYVLNNDSRIKEETRKKVFEAARMLNYNGNSGKKKSAGQASKNIIMNLHTIDGVILSELIYSAQKVFTDSGYRFYLQLNDYASYENWINGYIILNSKITNANLKELSQKRVPVVTLDRVLDLPNFKSVVIDNFDSMFKITEKVIQKGCTKFYYLGGVADSYDNKCRYEGFLAALSKYGINLADKHLFNGDFTFESGKTTAKYLIGTAKLPDAFICANDEMALGVIHTLRADNVQKPIIVTGFDGIYMRISDPTYDFKKHSFMSVKIDHQKIGNFAAYSLIEIIENKNGDNDDKIITIPGQLIEV